MVVATSLTYWQPRLLEPTFFDKLHLMVWYHFLCEQSLNMMYCLGVGGTCKLSVERTNQRTWLRIFIVYSDYLSTLSLAWMRETTTNIFPM